MKAVEDAEYRKWITLELHEEKRIIYFYRQKFHLFGVSDKFITMSFKLTLH